MSAFRPCSGIDAADYQYLLARPQADLPWEWLRRNPDYSGLDCGKSRHDPSGLRLIEPASRAVTNRWGCLHVEHASRRSDQASVLWSSAWDAAMLTMVARPPTFDRPANFDLGFWADGASIVLGGATEHLLLGQPSARFRADIIEGTLLAGPVRLMADIGAGPAFATAMLGRFLHLYRMGAGNRPHAGSPKITMRQLNILRAHDLIMAGASIRDVGLVLFGETRVKSDWNAPGEAMKSQCRRLIAAGRRLCAGGYRTLLG